MGIFALEYLAWIQKVLRIKEALGPPHPLDCRAVLLAHESLLDQANAVLAAGRPSKLQGAPGEAQGVLFGLLPLIALNGYHGMEIAIAYVPDDAARQAHLCQQLLSIHY